MPLFDYMQCIYHLIKKYFNKVHNHSITIFHDMFACIQIFTSMKTVLKNVRIQ